MQEGQKKVQQFNFVKGEGGREVTNKRGCFLIDSLNSSTNHLLALSYRAPEGSKIRFGPLLVRAQLYM